MSAFHKAQPRALAQASGCSAKDSFGTLDLARWGFDELFQAS
jgi:hypothetical protein